MPEAFLNLDILLADHGDQILDVIWAEVHPGGPLNPGRLHRDLHHRLHQQPVDAGIPAGGSGGLPEAASR